jgi:hypothetical protein
MLLSGRTPHCGRLAQLGERRVRNAEVAGSSPAPSTKIATPAKLPAAVLDRIILH